MAGFSSGVAEEDAGGEEEGSKNGRKIRNLTIPHRVVRNEFELQVWMIARLISASCEGQLNQCMDGLLRGRVGGTPCIQAQG